MSETKQSKLIRKLGKHMEESAGATQIVNDRYEGFSPGQSASGEMALERIMEDENQPRKHHDEESLLAFAEHLKIHGVQSPIELRWSESHRKWLIVFGHRRYRAAKLAGFKTIPCMFGGDGMDESTIRVKQLVENCQRENLLPLEMARAIKALGESTQWSNREVGKELGYSHVSIGRYLDLLKLPDELQLKVNAGELALTTAVEILRIKDKKLQESIGHEITTAGEKLTRSQARQIIGRTSQENDSASTARRKEKLLLTQNINVTIYRNPNVGDAKIQKELLAAAAQLDPEKMGGTRRTTQNRGSIA